MRDPFFLSPVAALSATVQPWADKLGLQMLPLHVHEVVGAALFYTFIQLVVSPMLSGYLFPQYYPRNSRGRRANWDSHVVSLVQSILINALALWIMFADNERKSMHDWQQRVWGYTGAAGLVQALAAGYFIWDLLMTLAYLDVFGLGLLAHAVSALTVYVFGFRPFLNYYGCVFILYELSTPFLNIHWFFDKLQMTGSRAQLYNGIALLCTFFSCRLVWGSAHSIFVFWDILRAMRMLPDAGSPGSALGHKKLAGGDFAAGSTPVPLWLAGLYIASNLVLNCLNWHWFFKMIIAVRKRFEPPAERVQTVNGAAGSSTGTEHDTLTFMRKRRSTIEDIVPDCEELREGTIQ